MTLLLSIRLAPRRHRRRAGAAPAGVVVAPPVRVIRGAGGGGLAVPDRIRPSPLEYIVRVLGNPGLLEPVAPAYPATRRFELLDFDVV